MYIAAVFELVCHLKMSSFICHMSFVICFIRLWYDQRLWYEWMLYIEAVVWRRSNFKKFTGKHLCRSLFLMKFQSRPMRKSFLVQVFSCEFYEICNNDYYAKYLPAAASELWRGGWKATHFLIFFQTATWIVFVLKACFCNNQNIIE